jgi:hypothetical protein
VLEYWARIQNLPANHTSTRSVSEYRLISHSISRFGEVPPSPVHSPSMDFADALEAMALNAQNEDAAIADSTVSQWCSLFGYTASEARQHIENHRADLSRVPLSDEMWKSVSHAQEALGHDRESYEYSIARQGKQRKAPAKQKSSKIHNNTDTNTKFLIKLEGPISDSENIKQLACLSTPPVLRTSQDEESGEVTTFAELNGAQISFLQDRMPSAFNPVIVAVRNAAPKQLFTYSPCPALGLDPTMPQHREPDPLMVKLSSSPARPLQNEYPVHYFFYGTLAEPNRLTRLLGLDQESHLPTASICGGKLTTWGGKYLGLVDGKEACVVRGWAYEVCTKEAEDVLRGYETDMYEVVRVDITIEGLEQAVKGLTFRFVGGGSGEAEEVKAE